MNTQNKFEYLISLLPSQVSSTLRPNTNAGAIHVANCRIAENGLSVELPQALVDIWMLHDGQHGNEYLFQDFALLKVAKAISEYSELCCLLRENDPYYDDPDPYAPKQELWEKWYDPILFPIGWTPGSGCLYLVHLQNEQIWHFNADGGLSGGRYNSIDDLLQETIEFYLEDANGG